LLAVQCNFDHICFKASTPGGSQITQGNGQSQFLRITGDACAF
jgi:hypothetical protein